MQRGTAFIVLGILSLLLGIVELKLTGIDYWWVAIALGAVVGSYGGISVSQSARA